LGINLIASYGITELDLFLEEYGPQKSKGRKSFLLLVDIVACKQKFFAFKLAIKEYGVDRLNFGRYMDFN